MCDLGFTKKKYISLPHIWLLIQKISEATVFTIQVHYLTYTIVKALFFPTQDPAVVSAAVEAKMKHVLVKEIINHTG